MSLPLSHQSGAQWLAGLIALAATLQVAAVGAINLVSAQAIAQAEQTGRAAYVWLGAAILVGGAVALGLGRRRAWWATAGLVPIVAVWWPLRGSLTWLGWVLTVEIWCFHAIAIAAAALALTLVGGWTRDSGGVRAAGWAAAPFVWVGVVGLLGAHLTANSVVTLPQAPRFAEVGAIALLSAAALATALAWPKLADRRARWMIVAIWLPIAVRIATATRDPWLGGPVEPAAEPWLALALAVGAVGVGAGLRPQIPLGLRVTIAAIIAGGCALGLWLWRHGFGRIEDGLGPLLRSFFAIPVPFPSQGRDAVVVLLAIAVFVALDTTYAGLVSDSERPRALALALVVLAGLGMASPHLVLLLGAGILLAIDAVRRPVEPTPVADLGPETAPDRLAEPAATTTALDGPEGLCRRLAARLGDGTVVSIDDLSRLTAELGGRPLTLTGRTVARSGPEYELVVGLVGRHAAPAGVSPGRGGEAIAHPIGATHRGHGDRTLLEALPDRVLDALSGLPAAKLELWEAGARVSWRGPTSPERVEGCARALAARIR